MSVGIGRMSKGKLQLAIEKVANDPQLRADFLTTLKGPQEPNDWLDFLEEHGLDSAAVSYIREHWQTMWQTYSYSAELVEAIMRQSLIEAIDLAESLTQDRHNPIPIDCHWIWTDDRKRFEVFITFNERQVTRILLTPPPPTTRPRPLLGQDPNYFVVKSRDRIEEDLEKELPRDPKAPWVTVQFKAVE